jgi:hypothetical protein
MFDFRDLEAVVHDRLGVLEGPTRSELDHGACLVTKKESFG